MARKNRRRSSAVRAHLARPPNPSPSKIEPPWKSPQAARDECKRTINPDLLHSLVPAFHAARRFTSTTKKMRLYARWTRDVYRQLSALQAKLVRLARALRAYEASGQPFGLGGDAHALAWVYKGIDLAGAAQLSATKTRVGAREYATARVVADYLVQSERTGAPRLGATKVALLAIATGIEAPPTGNTTNEGMDDNDRWNVRRKRWDEALRLARASAPRSDLAEFMKFEATEVDD